MRTLAANASNYEPLKELEMRSNSQPGLDLEALLNHNALHRGAPVEMTFFVGSVMVLAAGDMRMITRGLPTKSASCGTCGACALECSSLQNRFSWDSSGFSPLFYAAQSC